MLLLLLHNKHGEGGSPWTNLRDVLKPHPQPQQTRAQGPAQHTLHDGVGQRQAEGYGDGAGQVHEGDGRGEVRRVRDDGLQGDKDGGLGDAGAEAAGFGANSANGFADFEMERGNEPWENVEGFPEVGVAVPAEHEQQVAERGHADGEDDEGFVTAGSNQRSQLHCPSRPNPLLLGTNLLISTPEMMPPRALPTTAGTRCAPDSVLDVRAVIWK